MYYHEQREDKHSDPNTVWPEMSDKGKDFDSCKAYLVDRKLSWDIAEANGWYPSRQANDATLRVVIPAVSAAPGHVYWQARSVLPNAIRYQSPRGPRMDALVRVLPLALSESVVVGQDTDRTIQPCAVITEGPMDALAAADLGFISYALMGMQPPSTTLDHLARKLQRRPCLLCFDNEAEAQAQGLQVCLALASRGIRSIVCPLPAKDLAAMTPAERRRVLLEGVARIGAYETKKGSRQNVRTR